jgi:hypothetical protein
MEPGFAIKDVKQAVVLLREQIETIRLNLDILEILKVGGRIRETDQKYLEISGLNRRSQASFNEFVLMDLPGIMAEEPQSRREILEPRYLDWARDLHVTLRHLDRIIKDYMYQIAREDKVLLKQRNQAEIKDKRFWGFLDDEKNNDRLFESFGETGSTDPLNKVPDTEENEKQQEGEEK